MEYMGIRCWTIAELSEEKGIPESTIRSWIERTQKGSMDMPFIESAAIKGRYYIPVDNFLEWFSYIQN